MTNIGTIQRKNVEQLITLNWHASNFWWVDLRNNIFMVPEKFRVAFCERLVIGLCEQRFFGSKKLFSKKIYFNIKWVPVSSTQTPSVQQISLTQGPDLFSTQNPSVQHQNPPVQYRKSKNFGVELRVFGVELRDFRGWKEWLFCVELMCCTEGVVELRGTPNKIDYSVDGLCRDHPPVFELDDLTYFWSIRILANFRSNPKIRNVISDANPIF